jgi:hypothetical protein
VRGDVTCADGNVFGDDGEDDMMKTLHEIPHILFC